jgi:nucleoside 2-deoxyribosyltransferase
MALTVYLAGPEVFLANAAELGEAKARICRNRGLDAIFPFAAIPSGDSAEEIGHLIFERCIELMNRCDVAIANMTPFRGVSMDVGTAVEMGYMLAHGRPVFGYTNVVDDLEHRVIEDGMVIEQFGFVDNLMCEGVVWRSGGTVVRTEVSEPERLTDLRGFAACVEQVARRL